jgi:transcriptional regulator with XRE-family HTH domain
MVARNALGEFLRDRRGRLGPADVGLPPGIRRRQTPGLRREELAALAGVSVDYYVRLEQGRDTNPGEAVLDALARALRLTGDERAHLYALARNTSGRVEPRRTPTPAAARPGLVLLVEAIRPAPAYVLSPVSDILACNPEGLGLMTGLADWPARQRNIVRYVFTHPLARTVFVSWRIMAEDCVAHLRTVEASDPGSPALDTLLTELRATSPDFVEVWRRHDVKVKSGARRTFHNPAAGLFELSSEILSTVDGQRLAVFQAAPGTPDRDALTLLSLAVDAATG